MTQFRDSAAGKLVLSIAAGITVDRIMQALPRASVIRIMPNTPLQVGAGVSVLCCGPGVSEKDYALAERIFSASGKAYNCPESLINPVTALTSSSVAYFAHFAGAMCDWAQQNGFDNTNETLEMVCHTMIGTAELLLQSAHTPFSLEKAVTSPNGTTERAMAVFSARGLDQMVREAMDACRSRADELAKK